MIVIDFETGGVKPAKNPWLSVGALDFTNPSNQFYVQVRARENSKVTKTSLAINGFTKEDAFDRRLPSAKQGTLELVRWAKRIKDRVFAGENPSFERDFFYYSVDLYHIKFPHHIRTVDLHSWMRMSLEMRGIEPPLNKHGFSNISLNKAAVFVGLLPEPKPHNGLTGAKLEAEVFHRLARGKGLLGEYSSLEVPDFLKRPGSGVNKKLQELARDQMRKAAETPDFVKKRKEKTNR